MTDTMRKRVLVVDDDDSTRTVIRLYLEKLSYETVEAANGDEALTLLNKDARFDLILLDIYMPGLSGLDTLAMIDRLPKNVSSIPVIMISGTTDKNHVKEAIRLGARDFVIKPFESGPFFHRISRWTNSRVERAWEQLDPHIGRTLNVTFEALDAAWNRGEAGKVIDYAPFAEVGDMMADVASDRDGAATMLEAIRRHDGYTFVHSVRVGTYLTLFAKGLDFSSAQTATVAAGGTLHDIGKARTPLNVLNKPGPFDPAEWLVMKEHVNHTLAMIEEAPGIPREVVEIARNHHEKMDGTGYPRQLAGDDLSTLTRMASIVDAYVALTDRRIYKPAIPPKEALTILTNDPNHFDQELVTAFKEKVFLHHPHP